MKFTKKNDDRERDLKLINILISLKCEQVKWKSGYDTMNNNDDDSGDDDDDDDEREK